MSKDFRGAIVQDLRPKVMVARCREVTSKNYSSIASLTSSKTIGDNQFVFKKTLGSRHAIYIARRIVERFIKAGHTANHCSVDLS